jgi:hypothetical protein
MVDEDKIARLAEIGAGIISVQVELSNSTIEETLQHPWALGYCFGIFDAIIQGSKLDQYNDGVLLFTIGFERLMGDALLGTDKFGRGLDSQGEPVFDAGNVAGGTEFIAWATGKLKTPMGLLKWLQEAAR